MIRYCLILMFVTCQTQLFGQLPAFPGAEGFGANSLGGRGGIVIKVTNLNDSGSGSFRDAVESSGSRIIIFDISGTITLATPIIITNPFLTIAGQTAPGDGITIKHNGFVGKPIVNVTTHNVIIRYIRFRPGPDQFVNGSGSLDALSISSSNAYDIIVDHCSMSWAVDECMQIFDAAKNITVQWSIISEGLYCSTHQKTLNPSGPGNGPCPPNNGEPHSRGMTIATFPGGVSPDSISLHHNLWAHQEARFPNISSNTLVDFVNNVLYNPERLGSLMGAKNPGDIPKINYVKNYAKPGPSTLSTMQYLMVEGPQFSSFQIYVENNVVLSPFLGETSPLLTPFIITSRIPAPSITETTAMQAYNDVLTCAGVVFPKRDAVDQRIVDEVQNNTGGMIDHPNDVGGWPILNSIPPPIDTDGDGMPDNWENTNGTNSLIADNNGDLDGDGYTNIEEYINELTCMTIITSIEDVHIKIDRFIVYPNPTENYITIEWSAEPPFTIKVINHIGQIVWEEEQIMSKMYKLEIGNLPSGMYFIKAHTKDNITKITKVILK